MINTIFYKIKENRIKMRITNWKIMKQKIWYKMYTVKINKFNKFKLKKIKQIPKFWINIQKINRFKIKLIKFIFKVNKSIKLFYIILKNKIIKMLNLPTLNFLFILSFFYLNYLEKLTQLL